VGLVFLRLAAASAVLAQGIVAIGVSGGAEVAPLVRGLFAITVGVALLAGFMTPLAGSVAAIACVTTCISSFLASANRHNDAVPALNLAAICIALVFLGPGAFSLDARLFGRREIIIPENPHPPAQ
jgi:uncharacterized membrane protein YphA (DoxX/SURF4 family)